MDKEKVLLALRILAGERLIKDVTAKEHELLSGEPFSEQNPSVLAAMDPPEAYYEYLHQILLNVANGALYAAVVRLKAEAE